MPSNDDRTNREDIDAMRVVIVARRERPITRLGQVEKVLDKFNIGPVSHAEPGPISCMSTFDWSQNDDGSQIELEIVLHDDAQAPSLISELRACGFVASSGNFAITH
jgi:hypothetical protein